MKQADLDRAVARATGETVATIHRLGFLLADEISFPEALVDEQPPQVIDWDELETRRYTCGGGGPYEPAAV